MSSLYTAETSSPSQATLALAVGNMATWEQTVLEEFQDKGKAYFKIAERQLSVARAKQWLTLCITTQSNPWSQQAMLADAALTYAANREVKHVGDEVAFVIRNLKGNDLNQIPFYKRAQLIDPSSKCARRCLARLLLSASLEKNSGTALHRSFFRSGLAEVQLFPIVSMFLFGGVQECKGHMKNGTDQDQDEKFNLRECNKDVHVEIDNTYTHIVSLVDVAKYMLMKEGDAPTAYKVSMRSNNHLVGFLPLLSEYNPPVSLSLSGPDKEQRSFLSIKVAQPQLDLSTLANVNCSALCRVGFCDLHISTLAPLSDYKLPPLQTLVIETYATNAAASFPSLDGLTKENTKALEVLRVRNSDLKDISALSHCDLSALTSLHFDGCPLSDISPLGDCDLSLIRRILFVGTHLADLSPLQHCHLPSLIYLHVSGSPISDLSPLEYFPPLQILNLKQTLIVDISPLGRCDLSRLQILNLSNTDIVDLSPLSGCDLGSLDQIYLQDCKVSDLNPLLQTTGFTPWKLDFANCPIEDVSPISRIMFSSRGCSVILTGTKVEDISPFENISSRGNVHIDLRDTPISQNLSQSPEYSNLLVREMDHVSLYWN